MSMLHVQLPGLNMSSNTSLEDLYALYDSSNKSQTNNIVLIILYVPIFLLAVVGNIIILIAILTDVRLRRSSANYFLVNLAIADLLIFQLRLVDQAPKFDYSCSEPLSSFGGDRFENIVAIICIPMTSLYYVYNVWVLGTTICKITAYMQGISIVANVLTIVLMSVDRYFAIRQPMRHRQIFTVSRVRRLIMLAWLTAAVVVMPIALVSQVVEPEFGVHNVYCTEAWPSHVMRQVYDVAFLVCIYWVPGSAIVVLYTLMGWRLWARDSSLQRQNSIHKKDEVLIARRRLAFMMIIISVMFAACWLPYNIFNICLDFEVDTAGQLITVYPFTILLGHSNSAQNPVLYCFMHRGFKSFILKVIKCQCRRVWIRQRTSFSGSYNSHGSPYCKRMAGNEEMQRTLRVANVIACSSETRATICGDSV